ncbi:TIGR02270 family protein [Myxococcus sp. Y35]|uniref:TIGR02270 family protein n=1 Tax=Pseudomyxococcus flavus TaxID=3115648 RepID=UPI003CE8E701
MWAFRPDLSPRWDLLEEAFDEARYQWQQREYFFQSATLQPGQVAELHEERLRAFIDMLAHSASRVSERLLLPNLQEDDRECTGVAALALLAREAPHGLTAVLTELREGTPERQGWVAEALALSERPGLAHQLVSLLNPREQPEVQASALESLRLQGHSPGGAVLTGALAHPSPEARLAALRAARRWPRDAEAGLVRRGLESGLPELRAAALEAGLVQAQRPVWQACRAAAEAPDAMGRTARLLLALGGEDEDISRLVKLLDTPPLRPDTLWALGFSGRTAAADACLPWLEDPRLGGRAAEAFCAITGLVLKDGLLREREEEDDSLPPLEEDLRTPLTPEPDDALPLARASEVERWWSEARKHLRPDSRVLGGRPLTATRLVEALETLPMRRRPPLALELAIRTGGQYAVEPRGWLHVQRRQAAEARSWNGGAALRPFATWMSR